VDALSRLDMDDLKIQEEEEEALTLLLQSEHSNIQVPNAYCLDIQRAEKSQWTQRTEQGLSQLHYFMKYIEGYDLLCYRDKIYIPQSLRQKQKVLSWYHEYLLHPGQNCTEKTIRNTMTCPGLTQDVEGLCSTCPVCHFVI
jgi:Integrase zinc binding domain